MRAEYLNNADDSDLTNQFLRNHNLAGPDFEGTPDRVARMWEHFFTRYNEKPKLTSFPTKMDRLVIADKHIAWGFCPHHLLPVRYTFKIGYVPKGKALGLSKLPRLCEYHLTNLPLQEDLTVNIAEDLFRNFECRGVAVAIEGWHLCAVIRGVKSEDIVFKTFYTIGDWTHDEIKYFKEA